MVGGEGCIKPASFCFFCIGLLFIDSLNYNQDTGVLTCTSTGGPVTEVVWQRDEMPEIRFQGSQVITNTESAAYINTLLLDGEPETVVGNYSCSVSNSRGVTTLSLGLVGEQTVNVPACRF